MRRMIIPAAGRAERFGGVRKELLPLSATPGDCALRRAVERAAPDPVVIVTRLDLIAAHARALDGLAVTYSIQQHGGDLWGAILTALDDCDGGLLLPDTVWEGYVPQQIDAPIVFGVFSTDEPQRYSVLREGKIHTKIAHPRRQQAWGCVLWQASAARLMRASAFKHYDRAFEAAMGLGYATFPISAYHDLGSFPAYQRWMAAQCK